MLITITQPCFTNDNRVIHPGKAVEISTPVALRWIEHGRAISASEEITEAKFKPITTRKRKK
jgi:hypothetical protein